MLVRKAPTNLQNSAMPMSAGIASTQSNVPRVFWSKTGSSVQSGACTPELMAKKTTPLAIWQVQDAQQCHHQVHDTDVQFLSCAPPLGFQQRHLLCLADLPSQPGQVRVASWHRLPTLLLHLLLSCSTRPSKQTSLCGLQHSRRSSFMKRELV